MRKKKNSSATRDGYLLLREDIKRTTDELSIAYNNLENVVEPELIDYYIYQVKAASVHYKYLLDCAKKLEDSYTKNPL